MKTSNLARIIIGLLFVALGALLLMKLAGVVVYLPLPDFLLSWQMILIVLGIILIASRENSTSGLVLLFIGAFFMARSHFGVDLRMLIRTAIPLLLLLGGIVLLFPRLFFKKKERSGDKQTEQAEDLEVVNVFGGVIRLIESKSFSHGEITCVFAGADLNFKNAGLNKRGGAIQLSSLFSGCNVFVPEDWEVKTEVTTIFADVSDKRLKKPAHTDHEKVLYIRGVLLFSGLDIKTA
ncbi:MAG: LiaF transmembrane domain-containing protein [Bacteroidales bacterium]